MHAMEIVRTEFGSRIGFIHEKRRQALFRAVEGVIGGGQLWLTGLGRHLPGQTSEKHRIKAADGLLGNAKLQRELPQVYSAYAAWLLARVSRPVILVDASELNDSTSELRAALRLRGHAVTLYAEAIPAGKEQNAATQKRFLRHLAQVLPARCTPVLVTDAGFHYTWFDAVRSMGWHFVGRLRGKREVLVDGQWCPPKKLYRLARRREWDLGARVVGKAHSRLHRVVLAAKPRSKHRRRRTRKGTLGQRTADKRYTQAAREPWLLLTNLPNSAAAVVATYSARMQIEESFRDSKSPRYGWSLSHARSKRKRMAVLLFLGALAAAAVVLVGMATEKRQLHQRFQANTTRHRRVLSYFFLGCRVVHSALELSATAFREAIADMRACFPLSAVLQPVPK